MFRFNASEEDVRQLTREAIQDVVTRMFWRQVHVTTRDVMDSAPEVVADAPEGLETAWRQAIREESAAKARAMVGQHVSAAAERAVAVALQEAEAVVEDVVDEVVQALAGKSNERAYVIPIGDRLAPRGTSA